MLSAVAISTAGLYMLWGRRAAGDLSQYVGTSLNAVLIWLCVAMAWRSAVRRDFRAHRAWALRLYVVALAAWFLRVAFFLILSIFGRPVGFDPATSRGPLLTAMAFAQYVVPLAIVELYLRAQQHAGAFRRIAVAAVIFVVTVGMAVGIVAVSFAIWLPHVRAGFDTRTSIAQTLSQTIDARGIEPAIQQYRAILRTAFAARYNFEERELNSLGYDLLRAKRYAESIRIFQLNVEAYPRSSNVYDSLGEAYMKAGDTPNAIANYRRALALNPTSASATAALRKLTGR
jgi:tetratricopeptide (TPR) repeat protein